MTWIIISIPLMLLAIAIAVLPVLLTTIWESRSQRGGVAVTDGLVQVSGSGVHAGERVVVPGV